MIPMWGMGATGTPEEGQGTQAAIKGAWQSLRVRSASWVGTSWKTGSCHALKKWERPRMLLWSALPLSSPTHGGVLIPGQASPRQSHTGEARSAGRSA